MEGLLRWVVLFLVSSFLGWLLESGYRSIKEHRFIDSGLLSGPFIPIYGAGAVIIETIDISVPDRLTWIEIMACIIFCTMLEFLVHLFYEKVFELILRLKGNSGRKGLNGWETMKASLPWVCGATAIWP